MVCSQMALLICLWVQFSFVHNNEYKYHSLFYLKSPYLNQHPKILTQFPTFANQ